MMKSLFVLMVGLFFLPVGSVAAEQQTIVIEENQNGRELKKNWEMEDVTNAYPGYVFSDEEFLIINKTTDSYTAGVTIKSDKKYDQLAPYIDGRLLVYDDEKTKHSQEVNLEESLSVLIQPEETKRLVIKRNIKGKESGNQIQEMEGTIRVIVTVSQSQPTKDKDKVKDKDKDKDSENNLSESGGRLPQTNEFYSKATLIVGCVLLVEVLIIVRLKKTSEPSKRRK